MSGLNDFLFAAVGTEANGMVLSLVSVFARQGNDPWREAGHLANLPKPQAMEQLAQAIARMPGGMWDVIQAREIAGRLVALLPARPAKATLDAVMPGRGRGWLDPSYLALGCIAIVIGLLLAIWL